MEAIKLLLENGAEVNRLNNFGTYPLYAAISSGMRIKILTKSITSNFMILAKTDVGMKKIP